MSQNHLKPGLALCCLLALGGCSGQDCVSGVYPRDLGSLQFQRQDDASLTDGLNQFRENRFVGPLLETYYKDWHDQLTINLSKATALRIGPDQYPWLDAMVKGASEALGIEKPEVYVVRDNEPNAYVTNVERPILVIHSELIRILSRDELLFVVGHELGHIRFGHVFANELAQTLLGLTDSLPWEALRRVASGFGAMTLLQWRKESELTADRAGLLLVGRKNVAETALIRLVSGLPEEAGPINVEAFKLQRREIEEEAFLLRKLPVLLAEAQSTHPFVGTRVAALSDFTESSQYQELLAGGTVQRCFCESPMP